MNHQNEDHLDLRQKKTRRLLVEALAQLLTERPFQELSVVDICRRAMVHRTTFTRISMTSRSCCIISWRDWSRNALPPACRRTRTAVPGNIC